MYHKKNMVRNLLAHTQFDHISNNYLLMNVYLPHNCKDDGLKYDFKISISK